MRLIWLFRLKAMDEYAWLAKASDILLAQLLLCPPDEGNIKPVRTERSGNLHAVVNDPAGRKSDVATCWLSREEQFEWVIPLCSGVMSVSGKHKKLRCIYRTTASGKTRWTPLIPSVHELRIRYNKCIHVMLRGITSVRLKYNESG